MEQLKKRLEDFRNERNWKQFHDLKNLSIALSIEASELCELTLWKSNDEVQVELKEKEFVKSVQDECADILNYLILISSELDFDLIDAANKKVDDNAKKYPADKAFGTSKKYTEL